jgi:hypothetical protein
MLLEIGIPVKKDIRQRAVKIQTVLPKVLYS